MNELSWIFGSINQDTCRTIPPLVSAGGDQGLYEVRLPSTLTLQGEVHGSGPRGNFNLTSTWTEVSGPAPVAFTDPSSPVTNVLFTDPGTYVLQLEGSDGFLSTADRATVTVDPAPSLVGANLGVALALPGPLTVGTPEVHCGDAHRRLGAPNHELRRSVPDHRREPGSRVGDHERVGSRDVHLRGCCSGRRRPPGDRRIGGTATLASSTLSVSWTAAAVWTERCAVSQGWIASPGAARREWKGSCRSPSRRGVDDDLQHGQRLVG